MSATSSKRALPRPLPFADSVPEDVLRQIVFGTRVAASLRLTDAADLPNITAERIWSNVQSYLATGDWPDRRRAAAEIDADERAS